MAGRHFVDGPEPVQGAWGAGEGQESGEYVDEQLSAVADVEVGGDVSADLGIAAAMGDQHREGDELSGRQVEPAPGVVVTETVGR
mgnify:CR=1 FL=1